MDDWLRRIVARASTIDERLHSSDLEVDKRTPAGLLADRLATWRANLADDDALFVRRLGWDGLTPDNCVQPLHDVSLSADAALPAWALTLRDVMHVSGLQTDDRAVDKRAPVPFEEVLLPFVVHARTLCTNASGVAIARFEPAALASMEHRWLEWFSRCAARTLWVQSQMTQLDRGSVLDRPLSGEASRDAYEDMTARLRGEGLASFFEEYSALARLLATGTRLCAEASAEMIRRVDEDAEIIGALFGVPDRALHVVDLSASGPYPV